MTAVPAVGRSVRPARGIECRRATVRDVPGCLDVFYEAEDDLYRRRGHPILPRNPERLRRLFLHLVETDPERSWTAERGGALLGFGLASLRGDSWFLAFLFVRPSAQAQGIGRTILERCLAGRDPGGGRKHANGPSADPDPRSHGTCVESLQPISTGLYARYGMVPRTPLFTMVGRPDLAILPTLPLGVVPLSFTDLLAREPATLLAALAGVDRAVLDHERPQDHRWFLDTGRVGTLFRGPGGATLGYGYADPAGRLGPVALRDETLMPAVLRHLMASQQVPDAWIAFVPGGCTRALRPLLAAGLRFDGMPAIHCADRPGPDWERYLPATFALL